MVHYQLDLNQHHYASLKEAARRLTLFAEIERCWFWCNSQVTTRTVG